MPEHECTDNSTPPELWRIRKKGKDKKRKNRDDKVLAAEMGKALPRRQGKPDDLPFNFVLPSTPSQTVYK
jgi:hypothetical protein